MRTRATAYPIWNRFAPEAGSRLSMREQLVRFFRQGVADGTLQAGIRLPASRVLAAELKLSRITVSGAYEQLIAEGFLEARQGSGTYVAAHAAGPARAPAPGGSASIASAASARTPPHGGRRQPPQARRAPSAPAVCAAPTPCPWPRPPGP